MGTRLTKRNKYFNLYNLSILLVGLFVCTRIYRNSYTYASTVKGGIWNIISIVFLLLAIFFVKKCFVRSSKCKYIFVTVSLYSVAGIFNCFLNIPTFSILYIYQILMIAFYASALIMFYKFGNADLSKFQIKLTNLVFISILIITALSLMAFRTSDLEFVMVSNAYYPLCFLPFILMLNRKSKLIPILSIIIVGVILLFSNKRAGTIAYILILVSYTTIDALIQKKMQKVFVTLFSISFYVTVAIFLLNFFQNSYELDIIQRLTSIVSDGGSGRDWMYKALWDAIFQSDFISFIFGHGMGSAVDVLVVHDSAHNDFLGIFYEYGFIPFFLFVLHFIALFYVAFKMYHNKFVYTKYYVAGLFVSLVMSMFSNYHIDYGYVLCGAASLGFCLGKWNCYIKLRNTKIVKS